MCVKTESKNKTSEHEYSVQQLKGTRIQGCDSTYTLVRVHSTQQYQQEAAEGRRGKRVRDNTFLRTAPSRCILLCTYDTSKKKKMEHNIPDLYFTHLSPDSHWIRNRSRASTCLLCSFISCSSSASSSSSSWTARDGAVPPLGASLARSSRLLFGFCSSSDKT